MLLATSHRRALRDSLFNSGSSVTASTAAAAANGTAAPPPPYTGRILKPGNCSGANCKVFVLLMITFGVMAGSIVAASVVTKCG